MATFLHSEPRRLCSWWWDSHISPKNSKWLQENLTEIDAKVKAMIKIINEDADSFARRAEMYYKKRPELMKLVEDFYRAYRALAERYDHATGELRLAHKTMAEAFPNQEPSMLSDDISSSEPPSPANPHLVRAFFDPDYLYKESDVELSRKGLKQLNEMFKTGEAMLQELKSAEEKLRGNLSGDEDKDSNLEQSSYLSADKGQNHKTMIPNEPGQAAKAEVEMESLKEALAKMEAERDAILVEYEQNLEKLTNLEKKLNLVQNDAKELDKYASEAQSEVKALKESLAKLEAERDSSHNQYKQSSEKLVLLEATIAAAQEDTARWSDRAVKAETVSQNLKQELSTYEAEKQDALFHYEQSVEKISALEEKLLLAEENAKQLHEQIDLAESEIKSVKENLSRLSNEKEDAYLRYEQCLETISTLQNELMDAKEDIQRLNSEILSGSAKMRGAENQCALLEKMNESLKLEADDLVQKIAEKDQQLFEKHTELEKLMNCLQDEQSRFMQFEATIGTLQNLLHQSHEEQRALAFELKSGLQMLKDLELFKQDSELEIQHLREENRGLNDLKLNSSIAQRDIEHKILSLREIKEKLEAEVRRQTERNDALRLQVHQLTEEIRDLNTKYQDLLQQVQSTGIDPKCVRSFIKGLLDENTRLKEISAEERAEKEALLRKLEDMEGFLEKSAMLESSLSDVNDELESSKETMKVLQESCDILSGEKSSFIAEKSALLSQLQIITESMQNLLEKNTSLENSLQGANTELEGLRVKSKSLEDVCQLLNNEKSNLESERSRLISQLEFVEKKVESLETRFTKLEKMYAGLEKEKESTHNQLTELRIALSAEKQERTCLVLASEARLSGMEDRIHYLQEESKCRKKDFEEQLEKAVNAQVEIFILQKFMQDMEEKNCALVAECQKHAEAAKYSEKVISELESENMMQHLETEFLLDRIDKIRRGIFQVLKALEIDHAGEIETEIFLPHIPGNVKGIKKDLLESRDENQQLVIQNTVLSAAIKQLSSVGSELAKQKEILNHEFFLLNKQHVMLEHEKDELLERSRQLDILVAEKEREQEKLEAEMGVLNLKQESLQKDYAVLQEEHSNGLKVNRYLQDKLSKVEEENHSLFEENSAAIFQAINFSNESLIFKSSCVQKALEVERTAEQIDHLLKAYSDSENEAKALKEKLAIKETEILQLRELIQKLEEKNKELNIFNDQLNRQFLVESEQMNQKKMELFEAEQRIKALQDVNTKLQSTIECLEMRYEGQDVIRDNLERQVFQLFEHNEHQKREIVSLREANKSLENEVHLLNEDMEACNIREMILNSELLERSCEFELWEAEAESFYFDLQTSTVREALFENAVHELSGLRYDLEDVSTRRSFEIERMKDKISFLESESKGLKSQLAAYAPAIASLKKNISSLEQNPVLQTNLHLTGTPKLQVKELAVRDIGEGHSTNADEKSCVLDGLSELQELQSRIETIGNILVAERFSIQEYMNANVTLEAAKEVEELKSRVKLQPNNIVHDAESKTGNQHLKFCGSGPGTPELRNGTQMKDIPLDYVSDVSSSSNRRGSDRLDPMLKLWETAEQDSTRNLILSQAQTQASGSRNNSSLHHQLEIGEHIDTHPGEIEKELGVDKLEVYKNVSESKEVVNKKIILERLASDAQMLGSLHNSVQEMKRKIESNKKSNSTKAVEYERLRGQLQDIEDFVVKLVDVNTELTKTIKESSSSSDAADSTELVSLEQAQERKISEQAREEAERIVKLELDVQKIQYILLKLEDEKNSNNKEKSRFLRSQTGIILRNFIYSGGRKSRKQRKSHFCGCFRPSENEV